MTKLFAGPSYLRYGFLEGNCSCEFLLVVVTVPQFYVCHHYFYRQGNDSETNTTGTAWMLNPTASCMMVSKLDICPGKTGC